MKYTQHPQYNHIITRDEAIKLIMADDDNLGPGDQVPTTEEFNATVDHVTGMTLGAYADWRWPDEPQQQFNIALTVLNQPEPKYKVGDHLVFMDPNPEFEHPLDDHMIVSGEPMWNNYGQGYWEYPIQGKSNPSPEGLLLPYNKDGIYNR